MSSSNPQIRQVTWTTGLNNAFSFTPSVSVPIPSVLIADNETYTIKDYQLEGITISTTELKKDKSTRGHSHPTAEFYVFQDDCMVRLGVAWHEVKKGQMLLVRPKQFHKVGTLQGKTAKFLTIFQGKREELNAEY